MVIIKGIDENTISIDCNGKETTITPPIPYLDSVIYFDDTAAIAIKLDRFNHQWCIRQFFKGSQPSTLYFCTLTEFSDVFETTATPKRIHMLDQCAIEKDVMFDDL